jgi:hypothetical protein
VSFRVLPAPKKELKNMIELKEKYGRLKNE